jgi:flagellar biosynthesis protein FlhA
MAKDIEMKSQRNGVFNADVAFAFLVGGILFILLFPLPKIILSMLLVVNVSMSLLLLLLIFYLKKTLEISAYPTILLVLTLFRLGLNVATTKLILLEADAGSVITAFGRFVVGNNYVIGAIVFLILAIVNFMVIVKGSSRIAEVAARFTLDAMPGKQMSIDSDLNSGLIDEADAKRRRKELSDESEFYGAMDGASKFVTGDAIAGLIIVAINILGGIAIGVFQKDMPIVQALQTYTILTIGDGLVTQIPALFVSVSAGMLVAKTNSELSGGGTGTQLFGQFFRRHEPLYICAVMLLVLALLPGFPFIPFASVALCLIVVAGGVKKRRHAEEKQELAYAGSVPGGKGGVGPDGKALPGGKPGADGKLALPQGVDENLPRVNPMTLELGFSLIPLVDTRQGGDLVERISLIRRQIKDELGFLIPPISIQDNIDLANNEYRVLVRGLERVRGQVFPKSHLAINPGDVSGEIDGVAGEDPAFGFPAVWISPAKVQTAESLGYTVVDASSVVTTHVTKVAKDYAAELLSRQDVSGMLDRVKQTNEAVVSELVPNLLSIGAVHRVLQNLLDEQVPVHDLPRILEVLSDYANQTKDPTILSEFARQALKGHIVAKYIGRDRTLHAMTLDPLLEDEVQGSVSQGSGVGVMSLSPERAVGIVDRIKNTYEQACRQVDSDIVLLVSPLIRLHMFRMVERKVEGLPVLSYSEISDDIPLKVVATVKGK